MQIDWFFVNLHNKRVRSYWHDRDQTISCRVRTTKNNNSSNFRKNIIHYLYNRNHSELLDVSEKLNLEDWAIVQKVFGFDQLKFIKDDQQRRKIQFMKSQNVCNMNPSEVISALGLENVVSTKVKAYYKEIFFLKTFVYGGATQFLLRCLYHLQTKDMWMPNYEDFSSYKEEIMILLDFFHEERNPRCPICNASLHWNLDCQLMKTYLYCSCGYKEYNEDFKKRLYNGIGNQ